MHIVKEKIDAAIEKMLVVLEAVIAVVSIVVLTGLLCVEISHIFTDPFGYFGTEDAVSEYLHNMLTIVVGLEFVKLLMHLTPANILEVLIMAISRGIIVSHGDSLENLLSIACIVALFAAKRYLIPRSELHKAMDDEEPAPRHHRSHRKHKNNKQEDQKDKDAVPF